MCPTGGVKIRRTLVFRSRVKLPRPRTRGKRAVEESFHACVSSVRTQLAPLVAARARRSAQGLPAVGPERLKRSSTFDCARMRVPCVWRSTEETASNAWSPASPPRALWLNGSWPTSRVPCSRAEPQLEGRLLHRQPPHRPARPSDAHARLRWDPPRAKRCSRFVCLRVGLPGQPLTRGRTVVKIRRWRRDHAPRCARYPVGHYSVDTSWASRSGGSRSVSSKVRARRSSTALGARTRIRVPCSSCSSAITRQDAWSIATWAWRL